MSWMESLATQATTRWIAGGLLAVGGWALYQATSQTAMGQTAQANTAATTEASSPKVSEPMHGDGEPSMQSTTPSDASLSAHKRGVADRIEALVADRIQSERNHLWRVGVWGTANVIGGTALRLVADRTDTRGFGFQSAAWGAVNIAIATAGLLGSRDRPTTWRSALDAERQYHDILLVNLGLNVGYASVGTAMVVASAYDVDDAAAWRGHGSALILQGAGLLVLDAIAWLGSRGRIVDLLGMPGNLSARPLPVGGALTWRF